MIGEKISDDTRYAYIIALKYPNEWSVSKIQDALLITDDHRRHTVILDIYWGAQELAYD